MPLANVAAIWEHQARSIIYSTKRGELTFTEGDEDKIMDICALRRVLTM